MIGRLKDLNSSIKRRIIFNRDEIVDSSNEGIESQRENIVEEPVNNDIDIRSISQDDDREEADRQFVRQKLREIQNQTKRISFGQAFKNARVAGKKTFWWRGKEYNTKIKEEINSRKRSVTNRKSITTSNTSSNKSVGNKVTNNKQKNTIKSVSSEVAERRILKNRINQLSATTGFTTYQNYRNNYNANTARGYLNKAMQKPKTSPAFTADELKAINRAEANKRKRNR